MQNANTAAAHRLSIKRGSSILVPDANGVYSIEYITDGDFSPKLPPWAVVIAENPVACDEQTRQYLDVGEYCMVVKFTDRYMAAEMCEPVGSLSKVVSWPR